MGAVREMNFLKWLYPGLNIKRWIVFFVIGIFLVGTGIATIFNGDVFAYLEARVKLIFGLILGESSSFFGGTAILLLGILVITISVKEVLKSIIKAVFPDNVNTPVKSVYQRQYLRRGPKIVAIGGGTGLSVLLRGLKEYSSNITAIVSVADDGGSSGRLRGSLGILPPGDLRNCLVALADTETAMEKLFNYRFSNGDELIGHNLGNLLIAAMSDISGSFEQSIKEVSKVLAIRGRVLPSTLTDIVLSAQLEDGSTLVGESKISKSEKSITNIFIEPANAQALPEALDALKEADIIILGPGSLYTSIIPNLLIEGITEAIRESNAIKVYVANLMTQPGETLGFSVGQHLEKLVKFGGPGIMDYCIVNDGKIPSKYEEQYQRDGAESLVIDKTIITNLGVKIISADLVNDSGEYLRHNTYFLAKIILKLFLESNERRTGLLSLFDYYLISERLKDKLDY